jgi:hypothetical protein
MAVRQPASPAGVWWSWCLHVALAHQMAHLLLLVQAQPLGAGLVPDSAESHDTQRPLPPPLGHA